MQKAKRPRWPWFIFGAIIALATVASPLTAARQIVIVGVPAYDQSRVEAIAQSLKGQPWKLVNKDALLERVESRLYVDHATYQQNFLSAGELRVVYRKPVARSAQFPDLYIDENGQQFVVSGYTQALPTLSVDPGAVEPSGSISGGLDLVGAGKVAQLLTDRLPNYAWKVELDPRSVLFLRLEKGVRVVLGPADKLEAKIGRLSDILTQKAELWHAKEINLSVPNQPVYQP